VEYILLETGPVSQSNTNQLQTSANDCHEIFLALRFDLIHGFDDPTPSLTTAAQHPHEGPTQYQWWGEIQQKLDTRCMRIPPHVKMGI
jgi:hypothetical protein